VIAFVHPVLVVYFYVQHSLMEVQYRPKCGSPKSTGTGRHSQMQCLSLSQGNPYGSQVAE